MRHWDAMSNIVPAESDRPVGPPRRGALRAPVTVVGLMVAVNLADHVLHWNSLVLGPLTAGVLVLFARRRGLTWRELGLGRQLGRIRGACSSAVTGKLHTRTGLPVTWGSSHGKSAHSSGYSPIPGSPSRPVPMNQRMRLAR
jgi:hypothetical protein